MLEESNSSMIIINPWFSNGCQLMTFCLREWTEPAVFAAVEVAKRHDDSVRVIAFWVLVSAHASFWLDEIIRKLIECLNEDLPKSKLVFPSGLVLIGFWTTWPSSRRLCISIFRAIQKYQYKIWQYNKDDNWAVYIQKVFNKWNSHVAVL